MSDKLLEVKNLSVEYDTEISTVYAVNGLDLDLNYGETLGLVGETGAGKTTTALSVIQLLPEGIGFVTDGSIKLVHVFPNCLSVNIVSMTASLGGAILAEANLSFLGMGITPPTPSWGAMVSGGYKYLSTQPIIAIAPGIAIIIVVLCFNMCGDALRDALDPKLRGTLGSGKKTKRAKRTKNVKEVA